MLPQPLLIVGDVKIEFSQKLDMFGFGKGKGYVFTIVFIISYPHYLSFSSFSHSILPALTLSLSVVVNHVTIVVIGHGLLKKFRPIFLKL